MSVDCQLPKQSDQSCFRKKLLPIVTNREKRYAITNANTLREDGGNWIKKKKNANAKGVNNP